MLVKCVDSGIESMKNHSELLDFLRVGDEESTSFDFNVENFEIYLVVALALGPHVPWYFLSDRFNGVRYPIVVPATNFSIVDSRFSKFWKQGVWVDRLGCSHTLFSFEEWASSPVFHGQLFEGDSDSLEHYENRLKDLVLEYSLPWVKKTAISLEKDGWVADDRFESSWIANRNYEMTQDPNTGELYHNPYASNG